MSRSVTPLSILSVFLQTLEKCEIKKCLLVFLSASFFTRKSKNPCRYFQEYPCRYFQEYPRFYEHLGYS